MALQLKLHLAPEVLRCSGEGLEVEVLGEELPQQLRIHMAKQLLREWTEQLPGKLGASKEAVCGLPGLRVASCSHPACCPQFLQAIALMHRSWF